MTVQKEEAVKKRIVSVLLAMAMIAAMPAFIGKGVDYYPG